MFARVNRTTAISSTAGAALTGLELNSELHTDYLNFNRKAACKDEVNSWSHFSIPPCVFAPWTVVMNFADKSCVETVKGYSLQLKCDGTRCRTGGNVKGKLVNGVGNQYPSHYLGTRCIQHYYR